MRHPDPDDLDCCWCPARRFKTRQALADHEHEHHLADIALREAGTTLKDSRAMAERLASMALRASLTDRSAT